MIYLHGAGERGNNLSHVCRNAVAKLIDEGREIPAIVLCPQCPAEFVWNNVVDRLLSARRTDFAYVPESLEDMF